MNANNYTALAFMRMAQIHIWRRIFAFTLSCPCLPITRAPTHLTFHIIVYSHCCSLDMIIGLSVPVTA